jgi:cyclopropane fatty-acyl-phospholipid synthase-like methyltransferase
MMMKLTKNYWEERYQNGEVGWNVGKITTPIKEYIDQLTDKNIKILIPGAGNGYEFEYLIKKGYKNSFVVDYASTPIENIKKKIPDLDENQIINSDFFELEGKYDLIIEQTFFCALNPELREDYVRKMKTLLNTKGKIVGLLFQFPLTSEKPPFGGSKEEYITLFQKDFNIITMEMAYNSIASRNNKELFVIFEKK